MQNRVSLSLAAACCVALFITAGCSSNEAVKKDEGIAPSVTKPVAAAPSTHEAKPAANQAAVQPAPVQQAQKASSASQLQSALEKIYFDFNSADLSDAARNTLTKNTDVLAKNASAKIRIEGNCDDRGSAEYNMALGERRAKSAQKYLVSLGVKADRLSTISYGKEKPLAQGDNEAA